jgi:hypothetical protein
LDQFLIFYCSREQIHLVENGLHVAFEISSLFSFFSILLSEFRQSLCPKLLFYFLYVAISRQCCLSGLTGPE